MRLTSKRTLQDIVGNLFRTRHEVAYRWSWARDRRREIRDIIRVIRSRGQA